MKTQSFVCLVGAREEITRCPRPRHRRRKETGKQRQEKKDIPPPSGKVDRWRFFTHLARRASICIKLIGSPYWFLLLKNKRDRKRGRRRGTSTVERGWWRKTETSLSTPCPRRCRKGIRNKGCVGSC